MNEIMFTKDQLINMREVIKARSADYSNELAEKLRILIDKIDAMIDNYCEHPDVYTLVECGPSSGIHYCHKCKFMWKE